MSIRVAVVAGDVLDYPVDVLALKYAQELFGVDKAVVARMAARGSEVTHRLPRAGQSLRIPTEQILGARHTLFIGVPPLGKFDYRSIREWAYAVLQTLASDNKSDVPIEHLAVTLHGVGFGLDEEEAFRAEIAGLLEAVNDRRIPVGLRRISIVEKDGQTVGRLSKQLSDLLPEGNVRPQGPSTAGDETLIGALNNLGQVGIDSLGKPHVFVAMPFASEHRDRFNFGIYVPASAAGFICERADLTTFTGDVLAWVKERIGSASLVVGDLTGANPNVYLEVGYAWGRDVPTVLIAPKHVTLPFDVRGQRCLLFEDITDLSEQLRKELSHLKNDRAHRPT